VAPERLWDFLMDVPAVGRCVPGVERVEDADGNAYRGGLKVQIGPIRLSLEGTITVEEADREAWRAQVRAEANDRRLGGGIRARLRLALAPAEAGTRVRIDTDLAVLGRIGEFGQPVIRKKADALWRSLRGTSPALAPTSASLTFPVQEGQGGGGGAYLRSVDDAEDPPLAVEPGELPCSTGA
jgi:carbon monoxide dehydrogenase subunit G